MTSRLKVIGSCWVCKGPCRADNSTRIKDRTVGVRRLVHRGDCQNRAEVMLNAGYIEGGSE